MDEDVPPTGSESSADPVSQVVNRLKKFNLTGTRVKRTGDYYVARGGYADVWKGANGRKEVAIKVARRDHPKPGKTAQIVTSSDNRLSWKPNICIFLASRT